MGKVIDMDVVEVNIGWGIFLRVKIEIQLWKAIAKGCSINVNSNKIWVNLNI